MSDLSERTAQLEKLIARWRESAEWETDEGDPRQAAAWDQCADELAAVLALPVLPPGGAQGEQESVLIAMPEPGERLMPSDVDFALSSPEARAKLAELIEKHGYKLPCGCIMAPAPGFSERVLMCPDHHVGIELPLPSQGGPAAKEEN